MCYYCGEHGADTLDHTIPYSYYGPASVGEKPKARKTELVTMVDCCKE